MNGQLLFLAIGLAAGTLGATLILLLGYKWGKFAALKALAEDCPKWQAYLVALVPAAAFAAALLVDGTLITLACKSFWVLSAPAAIGACVRFNHGSDSAF